MQLIWQDEFDQEVLNEQFWSYEIGNGSGGWGNNELEYYRRENTSIREGHLVIEARAEAFSGFNYTSSRLVTRNNFDFKYGRVDIRALLPEGQGIWPALWALGDNIQQVGWPSCGEIDIMEMIGGGPGKDDTVHGTLHWSQNGGHVFQGEGITITNDSFQDVFHVFTMRWDATQIRWYLDDALFYSIDITSSEMTEFHEDFFIIFNLAVGGNWPGNPNASTVFPQRLIVDYIRVFQPE
jgi:beta-glucanase (GH16 family)